MDIVVFLALATALTLLTLGGGLYEVIVVDPVWPSRVDIVQPNRGGMSRKLFWIPAHVAFELSLIAALVAAWHVTPVRTWLLVALASHVVMRLWSAVIFIPRALAFERDEITPQTEAAARRWTRTSRLRLPLDIVTGTSMLMALVSAARV